VAPCSRGPWLPEIPSAADQKHSLGSAFRSPVATRRLVASSKSVPHCNRWNLDVRGRNRARLRALDIGGRLCVFRLCTGNQFFHCGLLIESIGNQLQIVA